MSKEQTDKKYAQTVILLVIAVFALIFGVIILVKHIGNRKNEPVRYDFEIATTQYITGHLDSFEQICEYDLEHYPEYKKTGSAVNEYIVPKSGEPFYNERKALFGKLGYEGFSGGYIYPDSSKVVFYDACGNIEIILTYYKNGNSEDPYRIAEHFSLICYENHH